MPFKDIDKRRAAGRKYRANNLSRESKYGKAWHLRTTYGITIEQFNAMSDSQLGRCAICLELLRPAHGTHVDHCHKTGKLRSLLCQKCNRGIGHFDDDPFRLEAAATYIRRHNAE